MERAKNAIRHWAETHPRQRTALLALGFAGMAIHAVMRIVLFDGLSDGIAVAAGAATAATVLVIWRRRASWIAGLTVFAALAMTAGFPTRRGDFEGRDGSAVQQRLHHRVLIGAVVDAQQNGESTEP